MGKAPRIPSMKGGGMADYEASLPYRVQTPDGARGTPMSVLDKGALAYPTVPPDKPATPMELLERLVSLLEHLPLQIGLELRKQLMIPGRDATWFSQTAAEATLAAGASVAVATQVIDERQVAALEKVGVNVDPAGSFSDVQWSILVNNAIHSKFGRRVFNANTLATPLPFRLELMQSSTVILQATNTGAVPVNVAGVLVGWQEPISEVKPYGSSPQGGI